MKVIFLSLVMCGCSSVEYIQVPTMPVAPQSLLQPCADMRLLNGNTQADLIMLTYDNAELYHLCKINNDGLIKWYNQQRGLNEKK